MIFFYWFKTVYFFRFGGIFFREPEMLKSKALTCTAGLALVLLSPLGAALKFHVVQGGSESMKSESFKVTVASKDTQSGQSTSPSFVMSTKSVAVDRMMSFVGPSQTEPEQQASIVDADGKSSASGKDSFGGEITAAGGGGGGCLLK